MAGIISRGNAAVAALGATQEAEALREVEAWDQLKGIRDMLAASARCGPPAYLPARLPACCCCFFYSCYFHRAIAATATLPRACVE